MKRTFYLVVFWLTGFVVQAQGQATEAVEQEGLISKEAKIILLVVWGLTVLFFTARTFRNKPDA